MPKDLIKNEIKVNQKCYIVIKIIKQRLNNLYCLFRAVIDIISHMIKHALRYIFKDFYERHKVSMTIIPSIFFTGFL